MSRIHCLFLVSLIATASTEVLDAAPPKPADSTSHQGAKAKSKGTLKVFVLAGQSNMVGAAKITTFDYIGEDPGTRPPSSRTLSGQGDGKTEDAVIAGYSASMGKKISVTRSSSAVSIGEFR